MVSQEGLSAKSEHAEGLAFNMWSLLLLPTAEPELGLEG